MLLVPQDTYLMMASLIIPANHNRVSEPASLESIQIKQKSLVTVNPVVGWSSSMWKLALQKIYFLEGWSHLENSNYYLFHSNSNNLCSYAKLIFFVFFIRHLKRAIRSVPNALPRLNVCSDSHFSQSLVLGLDDDSRTQQSAPPVSGHHIFIVLATVSLAVLRQSCHRTLRTSNI